MKKRLVNIIFLIIAQLGFAQEYTPFTKIYTQTGPQKFVDALETDSNLILLGSRINANSSSYIEVIRADKQNGDILSSNIIGANQQSWNPFQIFSDVNDELWVLGENEFMDHTYTHLMQLGDKDAVELDIEIGTDSTYQRMNFVSEVGDYFYMAGTYSSPDMTFGNDFWIVKMKKDGTIIWDQHFGIDTVNEVASSLQVSGDKIYVYGDKNLPNFVYNPYVITMDTAGNFISDTPLDWPYNCGVKISCITATNIYVTGESSTPTSTWFDIFLDKYDLQGNRLWRKLLPGTENSETGFDIKLFGDELYLTGYAHNSVVDNTDMHCTIIDTAGNILDQRLYNLGNVDVGYQVLPTTHGGFYIAGTGFNGVDTDYMLVFDTTHLLPNILATPEIKNDDVRVLSNPGQQPQIVWNADHTYKYVQIYNQQGKLVVNKTITGNNLVIDFLDNGLYYVVLQGDKDYITEKIVIE